MTRKPTNIFKVRELQRLKIQEYMLKGYPSIKIMELINMERQRDGLPQFVRASIYRMINEVKAEHNLWYYEMLKDQTAFIILHRQKILSIELYKRMLHEKIVLAEALQT